MQLAMTHAVTTKPTTWKKVPRRGKGRFCPINRFEGPAEFGCSFSHLRPILHRFMCNFNPPEAPVSTPRPEASPEARRSREEKSFRAEALLARSPMEKRGSSFTNKDSHIFDFLMVKILI
uniref:Uncharacterized protein n=1 Tax=Lactuca sativa TaxID=4236 RepID=A0A9R1XWP1_LACSA|nr:hypothetical protein LSAT_V11C200054510 [Lactuca sativa]